MVSISINNKIISVLESRGYSVGAGNNRKIISEMEANPVFNETFDLFRKKPFYRVIYQMINEEIPSTCDEIMHELNEENLKKIFSNSPLINLFCPNCEWIMGFYNPYIQKKPTRKQKCPSCHFEYRLNECKEEEEWNLTYHQVNNIMNKFVEQKLLNLKYYGYCRNHGVIDIEVIPRDDLNLYDKSKLLKYISQFYCKKCNNLNEIDIAFIQNTNADFFNNGVWFELYIKKLLTQKEEFLVDHSIRIIDNENVNYDVDVVVLKNNELYCIECKAVKPTKNIGLNDMGYIEKWYEFSDHVIISTTGKIKDRDKTILSRDNIQTFELMEVENIINLIN